MEKIFHILILGLLAIGIIENEIVVANSDNHEIHCVKWRATRDCDPAGERITSKDASCTTTIDSGVSGFCECENRRRVREVECEHHPFTCEKACQEDASSQLSTPEGFEYVTCGSTIKLVHENSRYRLHSHGINYGSGSGQQSVTAHGSRNDPNSYWLVKEGSDNTPCNIGEKISCNSEIRLEHTSTKKNLHSHGYKSPLSKKDEVSAFGVAGEGDIGDTWVVKCEESQQCSAKGHCEEEHLWKRGALVRIQNLQTGKYLSTSQRVKFHDGNCPGCPINGQYEISCVSDINDENLWFTGEGIYVKST